MVSSVSNNSFSTLGELDGTVDSLQMAGDCFWEIRFPSQLSEGHRVVEDFVARAQDRGVTQ